MAISLHFIEEDWARVQRDWTAWWAGELDRPLVVMPTYDTFFNASRQEFTRQFLLEKPTEEVLDYYQTRLEKARFYGGAFPKWCPYFGPGIGSGFLGGRVEPLPEQHTIWFESKEPVPYEQLHFRFDADNVWWRRAAALTRAGIARWGNRVLIAHTDIGGLLDILASFRTANRLLLDLYENPQEVLRTTAEIRTAWLRYYDELHAIIKGAGRGTSCWAPVWSPGRTYMHQCDFSYMISPKMFAQFVLPDLDFCFRQMEHAFYHLDGKGQIPHLDMLLSLKSLAGIQWVPGAGQPPATAWLPLLRRIRDGGKLCQLFTGPEDARKIVKEIGGRGFVFYIPALWTDETATDYLKTLHGGDISQAKKIF